MAFDGLTTAAIVKELSSMIINCRIDKIYQPEKTTLLFRLRKNRNMNNLLISSHPVRSRIHITEKKYNNPQTPPMFCMVLRKHLEGGKILSIKQPDFERQVIIEIENKDELGRLVTKNLICELMGKHSNIILLQNNNKIIDAITKYSFYKNDYRQILPGEIYKYPPKQNKINPLYLNEETFKDNLIKGKLEIPVFKALLTIIKGLGPDTCKEITNRTNIKNNSLINECGEYEFNNLWRIIQDIIEIINTGNYTPTLIKQDNKFKDFSPLDLIQYNSDEKIVLLSMSKAIDIFYTYKEEQEIFNNTVNYLTKIINKEIKRCSKKLNIQRHTIDKSQNAQQYKLFGELLTANIYKIKKGMKKIKVLNYYSEKEDKITINLIPELTPSENAQRFYKKYNKILSSSEKTKIQYKKTLEELNYLESVLFWLNKTNNLYEVIEIKEELIKNDYIKKEKIQLKRKNSKYKNQKPQPLEFTSTEGIKIMVGKNNTVNDYLTLKIASGSDIWLHVKDMPGSHVVISLKEKNVPEKTLIEAAMLAAYYSKGKNSSNVPVDYTYKKYVKKPKGAKPGMVIYENQKTLFMTPDEESLKNLLNQKEPSQ